MKVLVFGSMNIDKVYKMPSLPEKGETLYCNNYEVHVGGKGLNQAVSLSRAGCDVYMAGCIGNDGKMLTDYLAASGVNTELIEVTDGFTGHAVIEVDPDGQNQMVLYAGANKVITEEYCDKILSSFERGDIILLQYETSCVEYMINAAHKKGLTVAFNPSPFVKELTDFDYSPIDILILNEYEGACISKLKDENNIVKSLCEKTENGIVILTLGSKGAIYTDGSETVFCPAFSVDAIDTTGAGDTFTGYCIKGISDNKKPHDILKNASAASAIAVTKTGAAETIPCVDRVEEFLKMSI